MNRIVVAIQRTALALNVAAFAHHPNWVSVGGAVWCSAFLALEVFFFAPRRRTPTAGLDGPSKTITVEPVETPTIPEPAPDPTPAPEPEPEKVPA